MRTMRYIAFEKILTSDEISRLGDTITRLVKFSQNMTLQPAERSAPVEASLGESTLRDMNFLELLALVKLIFMRRKTIGGALDELWDQMLTHPGTTDRGEFVTFIMTVEPFARELEYIVGGVYREKAVLSSFYDNFREKEANKSRPLSVFPRMEGTVINTLIRTVQTLRNKGGHGRDYVFTSADRMTVMLAILVIVHRFKADLCERLLGEDGFEEFTPEEVRDDAAIMAWADAFVNECYEEMRRRAAARIVELTDITGADEIGRLPRTDTEPAAEYAPGLTYILGASGSGKSVMSNRLVYDRQPCEYTFYAERDPKTLQLNAGKWIVETLSGDRFYTLTPRQRQALTQWVSNAEATGKLALVADTSEPPRTWQRGMMDYLGKRMPGLMVIVTAEYPEDKGAALPVANAVVAEMQPLTDEEKRLKLLRTVSAAEGWPYDVSHVLDSMVKRYASVIDTGNPRNLAVLARRLAQRPVPRKLNTMVLASELARSIGKDAPLTVKYAEGTRAIETLAEEVYAALYGAGGYEKAVELIGRTGWLKGRECMADFFGICATLTDNEHVQALGTLAVGMLLRQGRLTQGAANRFALAPLAVLANIAKAVSGIEPDRRVSVNGDVCYRPSARFMMERMTVNLLRLYYPFKVYTEHRDEALDVMKLAVCTATPEVLDLLFDSVWAERWVGRRIFREVIAEMSQPVETMWRVALYYRGLALKGENIALSGFPAAYFEGCRYMNDAQRIELIEKLRANTGSMRYTSPTTAELVNVVVMTMNTPTATECYDTATKQLNPSLMCDYLKDYTAKGKWNRRLVFRIAEHAMACSNYEVTVAALAWIVRHKAYRMQEFGSLVGDVLDAYPDRELITEIISEVPLSDLDSATALRIYNPTLTEITRSINSRGLMTEDITAVTENGCLEHGMLRDMIKPVKDNMQYGYSLYSQSDEEAVLAVEGFADVQLKDRFVDLGEDLPVCLVKSMASPAGARYVHLTARFPETAFADGKLPETVRIKVSGSQKSIVTECVRVFAYPESRCVIFRIDDAEVMEQLCDSRDRLVSIKTDKFVGYVTAVDVRYFGRHSSLMRVSLNRNKPVDLPETGTFSVHYLPRRNDPKFAKTVQVFPKEDTSHQWRQQLPDMMIIDRVDGNTVLLHPGKPLKAGTLIYHKPAGTLLKVTKSKEFGKKGEEDPMTGRIFRKVKQLREKGVKVPFSQAYTEVSLEQTARCESMPDELQTPGTVIDGRSLELKWISCVFRPEVTEVRQTDMEMPECTWIPAWAGVNADGKPVLQLPEIPEECYVQMIAVNGIPFRFAASLVDGQLQTDPRMNILIADAVADKSRHEPFFIRLFLSLEQEIAVKPGTLSQVLQQVGSERRLSRETIELLVKYMCTHLKSVEQIGRVLVKYGRIEEWLTLMLAEGLINAANIREYPFVKVSSTDKEAGLYNVCGLGNEKVTARFFKIPAGADLRKDDILWYVYGDTPVVLHRFYNYPLYYLYNQS